MWEENEYVYTKGMLKKIASSYSGIYNGIEMFSGEITNPFSVAEYKADFDRALDEIGKGNWTGELKEFKDYRYFGELQKLVIADIYGITNRELEGMGFYDIPRLKRMSYSRMAECLNR